MGYILKHRKQNGKTEIITDDCQGNRQVFETSAPVALNPCFGKKLRKPQVQYNFRNQIQGGRNSATARVKEIRDDLEATRASYTNTKGWSKDKRFKHVASIPPEYWFTGKVESGGENLCDKKDVMKLVDDHGFRVS
jgi:hypothetical protein